MDKHFSALSVAAIFLDIGFAHSAFAEQAKLRNYVEAVHVEARLLRFWATTAGRL